MTPAKHALDVMDTSDEFLTSVNDSVKRSFYRFRVVHRCRDTAEKFLSVIDTGKPCNLQL